ncbi:cell division cycle protein 20 homolog [Leptidea sinapis]|uniref:cell division cycle protein 20 homolog n=1 Tax=Leptidea sinapis TaxID=189913 RepID=UPI0021294E27|nr:cell division cycle protein 20 homolog [Leptidea sinapis]
MAQFNYLNELNSLATIDGPLTRGPLQRWAKKTNNENMNPGLSSSVQNASNINVSSCNQSMQKLSISVNQSCNNSVLSSNKTPTRTDRKSKKTPSKNKSPGRSTTPTPSKASKTPNKGDRFIPSRSNSNYDLCHYMMSRDDDKNEEFAQTAVGEALGRALTDTEPGRLLQYTCKAPAAPEGYQNRLRVVYSQAKVPSTIKNTTRYIPQSPDRILDAPDILDDYYLNLVDWSSSNILAVALRNSVYLWNAGTGQIELLLTLEGSELVTSVAWLQGDGAHLAVGTTDASVQLWDCETMKRLRKMGGHTARVGALAWNLYVVSSGSRDGNIIHHDVRQREHAVTTINAHTQEVCGLKWSPDGKYLASGGNDNLLNIWPIAQGQRYSQTQYLYSFNQHLAAVKGLAWCPWSSGILASGGGTADRTIRIWNVNTGVNLNTVDTKSQVCSILWSTHYKELISGHGYVNNQLIIWKYPVMSRVAELNGHMARVLHMALSPDGSSVLSAGADETLRLWKCFMLDPIKKKDVTEAKAAKSLLNMNSLFR